jgi:hypothetical protein
LLWFSSVPSDKYHNRFLASPFKFTEQIIVLDHLTLYNCYSCYGVIKNPNIHQSYHPIIKKVCMYILPFVQTKQQPRLNLLTSCITNQLTD